MTSKPKVLFDRAGRIVFGQHKGKRAAELPAGWAAWACDAIAGFKTQWQAAKNIPEPAIRPKGRTYILNPHLKYVPRQ